MDFKTFLEHFDTIAQAPNGIAKLRSLILDLAVQGKLVQQNPEDEPASKFFVRIKAEQERLIQEKKIRKPVLLPPIEVRHIPHDLPAGWIHIHLGEFVELISGQHLGQEEQNIREEGLPYLTGPADFGEINPTATRWTCTLKAIAQKDDVLITVKGAGVGKANILGLDKAVIGRQLMAIRPIFVSHLYIYLLVIASYEKFQALSIGSTVPGIGRDDILQFPVKFPPLAEQKRIVEKVDELMALCDRLQQSQETRDHFRQKLRESAIASLMNAETDEALQKNWAIVRDNWHTLSQKPEDVADLRRSVIQLAIEGKLTGQDPVDEPAFLLVEKIKAEKKKLAQENKKKFEVMPPISNELAPSRLPEGWTMEYLGNLVINFQNGFTKRKGDEGKPIPVLRLADIKNGSISQDSLREIPMTASEIGNYQVNNGDILVIRVNGSLDLVGQFIPCLINREWAYSDHLIRVKISSKCLDQQYLCIFAKS